MSADITRSHEATPGRQAGNSAGARHRPPGAASSDRSAADPKSAIPDLPHHPLAELLPAMTDAEYQALKASILATGRLVEPIVLLDGQILDGRHRHRACRELGIAPQTRTYDPAAEGDPVTWVYSRAVHRNLTDSQKACAAVKLKQELAKSAQGRRLLNLRQYQGDPDGADCAEHAERASVHGRSDALAGELFGVSGRYVSEAEALLKAAPKLFRQVFDGQLPITRAKREYQRTERAKAMRAKVRVAGAVDTAHIQIITGDCLGDTSVGTFTRGKIPPARMVFCDPPYNIGIDYGDGEQADRLPDEEYLAHVIRWLDAAQQRLAEDGSLWWMISDEYAAETACLLKQRGFTVQNWIKWYETFGVNCASRFNRTSRHLFYCTKHPTRRVWHPEAVTRPSDRQAKYNDARANPNGKLLDDVWEIPRLVDNAAERVPGPADGKPPTQIPLEIVRRAIECSTDPGDLVMDLFCGSGTTAHQCLLSGRKFLGWEINPDYAEIARLRVQAAAAELAAKEVA